MDGESNHWQDRVQYPFLRQQPYYGWSPTMRGLMTAWIDNDTEFQKMLLSQVGHVEALNELTRAVGMLQIVLWKLNREPLARETLEDPDESCPEAWALFREWWGQHAARMTARWEEGWPEPGLPPEAAE